ncbi:MAG: pyrimidine 5'-nucleotidase [Candidatus Xenobia bacterium]
MTRHWLFDLDDTLYPASAGLFPLVSRRITERISALLSLPPEEARVVQRRYWKEYGTSMRGLIVNHGVDPEPFLAYVHDVPVEQYLGPDPALRHMLERLGGPRHVFTNSPSEFADRVLAALGVADLFESVFDIRHAGYVPKPNPDAYHRVLARLACDGSSCIMIDDSMQNLHAARQHGIRTVWLRAPDSVAGGRPGGSVALAAELPPADYVIERILELESRVFA